MANVIVSGRALQKMVETIGLKATAEETGLSLATIGDHINWLTVPLEIQAWLEQDLIPGHVSLLTRIKKLSADQAVTGLKTLIAAGAPERGRVKYFQDGLDRLLDTPVVTLRDDLALRLAEVDLNVSDGQQARHLRAAARAMCQPCEVRARRLENELAEPAWALLVASARQVCGDCHVQVIARACESCPGVAMLRALREMSGGQDEF
ncbi:MAG: hypothetical protein IPO08_23740 [Xanthomonadales bacterium]|nr:hypothetical protein [Xanthomonadales bacterium]